MKPSRKLVLWGVASVALFVALLGVTNVFSALVADSDRTAMSAGSGMPLIIGGLALVAALLVTAVHFFKYLAITLEIRRNLRHQR